MNREFLINIVFLIAINLLIKPFYIFGIDRTVQNTVGTDLYGLYFALFGAAMLWQIFNDFGIQNFNNRFISQHRHLVAKYLPDALLLKGVLSLGYMAVLLSWAWLAGYGAAALHLLTFMGLTQVLGSLVFYFRSNIAGLGLYRIDSLLSAGDRLLLVVVMSWLLWGPWGGNFQIQWFVYAQTATMGLTALLAGLVVWRQVRVLQFRWKPVRWLLILRKSFPFALVIFLMTLYTRLDAVMLERLLPDGAREAGIYASAYRLLDAGNMIGYLFAGLLLPMFSRLLQEKQGAEELALLSFRIIMVGAIATSTAVYFYQFDLAAWMYKEATVYWGEVLGGLMWTFVAGSGSYIFGTLLTANGKLRAMNFIFSFSILLNVVLNLLLIFMLGALGAALATVITQFFVLIAQILLANSMFQFKQLWITLLNVLVFGLAVFLSALLLDLTVSWDWRVKFLGILLLAVFWSFLLRLLRITDLRQFLRRY